MKDDYSKAMEILKKFNQEHLLAFYDELSEEEQKSILNQIFNIDFDEILALYQNSMIEENNVLNKVTPLYHYEKNFLSEKEISIYT